jgi:DNA repair protein RadC
MTTLSIIIFTILILIIVWNKELKTRRFRQICVAAQVLKQKAGLKGNFFQSPYSSKVDFLEYIGQFFKYKKHEWIFVAFMRDNTLTQFWINKGPDNDGVSPFIAISDVAEICKQNKYNRVLIGHNHPSGALRPSEQDRVSLEEFMDYLAQENIKIDEYVFVAGDWCNYGLSLGQHIRRIFKSIS